MDHHHQADAEALPGFGAEPWVIRFRGTGKLINPFDGSSRDVLLPVAVGKTTTCLGCFGDRSVLLDEETKACFLLDLATLSTVPLPPLLEPLPAWPGPGCALSSPATAPDCTVAVVVSDGAEFLLHCRPGDKAWFKFFIKKDEILRPMHGSNGRIYVTSSLDWELLVINMDDSDSGVHVEKPADDAGEDARCYVPCAYKTSPVNGDYLSQWVESNGEVFLLRFYLYGYVGMGLRDWDIHRLDTSKLCLELVESIGDRTIFSGMESVAVSPASEAGTQPDCIHLLYPFPSDGLRLYTIRLSDRTVTFKLVPTDSPHALHWAIPRSFRLEQPRSRSPNLVDPVNDLSGKMIQDFKPYPMLMSLRSNSGDKYHLIDPMTAKQYNLNIGKKLFCGDKLLLLFSKHGWVLITEGNSSVTALNPFTKESLSLPPLDLSLFNGISFSTAPTSPDSVFFVFHEWRGVVEVLVWRPGDEDWTSSSYFPDTKFKVTYNNPLFFDGEFYCMGSLGNLAVFSPSDMEWRVLDKPERIYDDDANMVINDRSRAHLTEFSGELIAVFMPQDCVRIEMFKLDMSLMVWTKLERLDNATMFVDNWGAIIVPQPESSLCNRIYLPKFGFGEDGVTKVSAYYDIGAKMYQPTFYGLMEPMKSIWIQPNFTACSSRLE